jgi:hypothetical protein
MYRTSNILWEYYVVKIAKRSARDRRTIVRTLASSQKSSRKAAELSVATGRVIAKRAALGVAAMVDPARADHKEFARILPEKMMAFSRAALILMEK